MTAEDGYLVSYEGTQIGTGTKISLTENGKTTVYEAVIFGDVDGNGIVDGNDSFIVTMIINGLFTKDTLGSAVWFAADVTHDGAIDAADLDLITKAGLKLVKELLPCSVGYICFVYKNEGGYAPRGQKLPKRARMSAHSVPCADQKHGIVLHRKRTLGLAGEVHVPRGVDKLKRGGGKLQSELL